MEINNKTLIIVGVIICSIISLILNNHDIAIAGVSGLLGYLSKDLPIRETEQESEV